jgi:hypothetical protein
MSNSLALGWWITTFSCLFCHLLASLQKPPPRALAPQPLMAADVIHQRDYKSRQLLLNYCNMPEGGGMLLLKAISVKLGAICVIAG